MLKILSISVLASFLLASNAIAQPRFPCAADIKKSCADVEPGGGRLAACIKEHFKDLSDVCKERLSTIASSTKACRDDVQKACGSVESRVRKAVCIMDALSDLGDACKDSIARVVSGRK
jgi:hypothetical protein